MSLTLFVGTSGTITLPSLVDSNNNPVNNAVVTGTLYDPAGNPVAGFTNVTFTYVPLSNGNYSYVLPCSFWTGFTRPVTSQPFNLVVTATASGACWERATVVQIQLMEQQ